MKLTTNNIFSMLASIVISITVSVSASFSQSLDEYAENSDRYGLIPIRLKQNSPTDDGLIVKDRACGNGGCNFKIIELKSGGNHQVIEDFIAHDLTPLDSFRKGYREFLVESISSGELAILTIGFDGNAYERVSQVKKLDILDVEILNLQKNLNILGYNTGKPDAVLGNKSKQAIRKIQRELGAPADGIPSEEQRYHIQDLADQKREEFAKLNRNQLGQRREATRIDDDKSAKAPSADAAVQGANLSCGDGITFSAKYQKAGSLDVLRLSQNGKSVSNLRKTATAPDFSERYEFGNNYAHFDGDAVELALNGETYFCEVGPNSANQDANAETTPKL